MAATFENFLARIFVLVFVFLLVEAFCGVYWG
jgi:hypothetical protein